MSQGEEDRRRDEIVLVRRVGEAHDGGHHGGAWKIAYADFMTAMMALFLVMWLVNAASDDAKRQVANYFNPIKLSDSFTTEKGLSEFKPSKNSNQAPPEKKVVTETPAKKVEKKVEKTKAAFNNADFFSDPHGVLAKLAKAHEEKQPKKKGEAFRDPFDPAFRKRFELVNPADEAPPVEPVVAVELPKKKQPEKKPLEAKPEPPQPTWKPTVKRAGKADPKAAGKVAKADGKAQKAEPAKKVAQKKAAREKAAKEKAAKEKAAQESRAKAARAARLEKLAETLKHKIEGSLARLSGRKRPLVNIKVTDEGVILSLTDKVGHSMFDIGSAVPKPETVALVDTLAAAIKENHDGRIVISGHTDARAFSGAKYDNWRLSTDRAHAFYRMLERGGVDMRRIDRVQGYAARKLKVASDPNSPLNRRVEITLQTK